MKRLMYFILVATLVSITQIGMAGKAEAPKGKSTLATETDMTIIQELFLTTDYEKMTESEYVAIIKHLGKMIRAVDISTDKGKIELTVLFNMGMKLSSFLSQGGPKNYTKEKLKKDIDDMTKNIKTVKKEDLKPVIDQFFSTDDAKLKQEYQRTLAVRNNYKKSLLPTKENLISAVHDGRTEVVKELIKAKVDVNVKDKNNISPLMDATISGRTEIVKLLLDARADVNVKDDDNNTPLKIAAGADQNNRGRTEIVKLLLAARAKVNEKSKYGTTALIGASFQGNTEVVKMLISAKADLNIKDSDGYSALKMATSKGFTEIVDLLKKAGAKE